MILQMLQKKDVCLSYDLSSIRYVLCAAAPVSEEVVKGVEQLFPTWAIGQAYGTHEVSGASRISS